jgi:hypothetical protein
MNTCPILTHLGIDLAVRAFQPGGRDQRRATMPWAGQVDRLLPRDSNEPGHVDVNERESRAGSPVAKQPWLDVISAERPFQQRVVFEVDLPDCEVVAGSPPRIYGGQLTIGQRSEFVAGDFKSHRSSLNPGAELSARVVAMAATDADNSAREWGAQALPGDFPPLRRRVAPYTAAWVRRCMPSLVSRPDT